MSGGGSDAGEELNLIPYLDIMVNLVIFLLFSFTVVVEFVRVELRTPAYGQAPGGGDPTEIQRNLTVVLTQAGFTILSVDPTMHGKEDIACKTMGRNTEGATVCAVYDTDKLHERLVALKSVKEFNLGSSLILTADPAIPYNVVVETMDASRKDGKEDLFPDVLLARTGPTGGAQ